MCVWDAEEEKKKKWQWGMFSMSIYAGATVAAAAAAALYTQCSTVPMDVRLWITGVSSVRRAAVDAQYARIHLLCVYAYTHSTSI